jgi:hypothetical protein
VRCAKLRPMGFFLFAVAGTCLLAFGAMVFAAITDKRDDH